MRCLTAEREVSSLWLSVKLVIVSDSGVEMVVIWFVETDRFVSDGN